MVLPLRLLPSLQVNRKQKIGLGAIFGVGAIVIATAIVRLTQIVGQERSDPVGLAVWGIVESSVSVVVGCLPSLKTFLSRVVQKTFHRGGTSSGSKTVHGGSVQGGSVIRANYDPYFSKTGTMMAEIPLEDNLDNYTTRSNKASSSSSTRQIVCTTEYGWSRESECEV